MRHSRPPSGSGGLDGSMRCQHVSSPPGHPEVPVAAGHRHVWRAALERIRESRSRVACARIHHARRAGRQSVGVLTQTRVRRRVADLVNPKVSAAWLVSPGFREKARKWTRLRASAGTGHPPSRRVPRFRPPITRRSSPNEQERRGWRDAGRARRRVHRGRHGVLQQLRRLDHLGRPVDQQQPVPQRQRLQRPRPRTRALSGMAGSVRTSARATYTFLDAEIRAVGRHDARRRPAASATVCCAARRTRARSMSPGRGAG